MFDVIFTNPPFNHTVEFEEISVKQSNQYIFMITKTSHMVNMDKFKNVVYFKNLGRDQFKENVEISSYLIDKNKQDNDPVYVEGLLGKPFITNKIILTPGIDVDAWKFAQDVVDLGLLGYDAYRGEVLQRTAKIVDKDVGIKCIWSAGGTKDTKFVYVDKSQGDGLFGLGYHKIFVSYRYQGGALGGVKYSPPEEGLSFGGVGIIMKSEQDSLDAIEYLNSPQVKKFVKGIKLQQENSKVMWQRIPHHSLKDKWFHLYV